MPEVDGFLLITAWIASGDALDVMLNQHWMHASPAGLQLAAAMPGDVRGCDVNMQLWPGAHTGQPAAEGHGWPTGENAVAVPLVV